MLFGKASQTETWAACCAGVPVWYTAVVPLPLALPDLVQRLQNGYYRHAEALEHDASTIASNAELYNGAGSDVANTAAGKLPPAVSKLSPHRDSKISCQYLCLLSLA